MNKSFYFQTKMKNSLRPCLTVVLPTRTTIELQKLTNKYEALRLTVQRDASKATLVLYERNKLVLNAAESDLCKELDHWLGTLMLFHQGGIFSP